MLREDDQFQETLKGYVYIHLFRDKDGEAFAAWSRRHKAPVQAIPQINIVSADGKLVLPLKSKPTKVYLLTQPGSVLESTSDDAGVTLKLPAEAPDKIATVIALEISGTPDVIAPASPPK